MMRSTSTMILVLVIFIIALGIIAGVYLVSQNSGSQTTKSSTQTVSNPVQVVAAEDFWGSLVSQLGGVRVNVTSILSDPNVDPHEYESNPANGIAIADARLVIVNGAGYDTWAEDILSSENEPGQVVLNVQQVLNLPLDANPHFWYSPYFVNATVRAMYNDLVKVDPTGASYFTQRYSYLNSSLYSSYMKQEAQVKQQFSGTPVAATEDIFAYMANATGLRVVSPLGFMQAVAEGSDPSAQDVATFQDQLNGGNSTVRLLVYNEQTVTPLTQSMLSLSAKNGIPSVHISETIQPPNLTFQAWMQDEVIQIQNALNAGVPGK